jgi:hypothetical protein
MQFRIVTSTVDVDLKCRAINVRNTLIAVNDKLGVFGQFGWPNATMGEAVRATPQRTTLPPELYSSILRSECHRTLHRTVVACRRP